MFLVLGPRGAHALAPQLRGLLDAAGDVLLALHLDLQQQLEVVVLGPLGLLVVVGGRLDGGHDGLDVAAVVDEEGDGAPGAGHDLGELGEGEVLGDGGHGAAGVVGHLVGGDVDGEGAEVVWVEAPAVGEGLELGLEVGVDGAEGGDQRGKVEGVDLVGGGGVIRCGGGGGAALTLAGGGILDVGFVGAGALGGGDFALLLELLGGAEEACGSEGGGLVGGGARSY